MRLSIENRQSLLSCFFFLPFLFVFTSGIDEDVVATSDDNVDQNAFFGGAAYDASGVDVKLRSMPRALDGAANKGAVRERPTLVSAAIPEGDDTFCAAS